MVKKLTRQFGVVVTQILMDVLQKSCLRMNLILVSAQLATAAKWDVIQDSTEGSDHYPIICEVGVGTVLLEEGSFPRWKLRKANWGAYSMMCSVRLEGLNPAEGLNPTEGTEPKVY